MARPQWLLKVTVCLGAIVLIGLASLIFRHGKSDAESASNIVEWFAGLSLPDLETTKLVRVSTGGWSRGGNDPPSKETILAFLLSEHGDDFKVFTLDLQTRVFTKSGANTPFHEQVGFEVKDLQAEVADLLEQFADPDRQKSTLMGDWEGDRKERVELFTLARACAAQKLDAEAQKLIDVAANLRTERRSFKEAVSEDIAYAMMWRAIMDFDDLSINRNDLLVKFNRIQRVFPDSTHAKRASDTAAILKTMIEEDVKHAQRKLSQATSRRERIAELVFQLRDQNGKQWSQPGWCDVFEDPRGEDSPAAQLRKIGLDAIPELIKVIDDNRFTRSVGYHRDFYFSHDVLTIGQCAETIIANIARKNFRDRGDKSTKRNIEKWWNEIREKGEMQVAVESAERGDEDSVYQSHLLLEKYPHVALAAIRKGIIQSENEWIRTRLVELATQLKDEAVEELLLDQLNNALGIATRVAAARGLLVRNRPEPVPVVTELWKRSSLPGGPREESALASFLAHCGNSDAIEALADGLNLRSIDLRLFVVSEFGKDDSSVTDRDRLFSKDPGTETAIEDLLIGALVDTEPRLGMSGGIFGHSYTTNPRICDMAAHVLSQRFKDRYQFDVLTPLHERDRQILVMQNHWRLRHGLAALPSPARPKVPQLPADKAEPALSRIADAGTLEETLNSMVELENLGLTALPEINKLLGTLPSEHTCRKSLATLASRLANTITEVEFESNSFPPDESMIELLNSQKGEPLDENKFIALLVDSVQRLPIGACGSTVTAYRYDDNSGVRLMMRLHKGDIPKDRSSTAWSTHESVDIGTSSIHNTSGSSAYDYAMDVESRKDFKEYIAKALASTPSETFLIRAALSWEGQ